MSKRGRECRTSFRCMAHLTGIVMNCEVISAQVRMTRAPPTMYILRSRMFVHARLQRFCYMGTNHNVPVWQAYEFHTALKDFGIDTNLVIYPNEGHTITD